jgi:hypothetical protein
MSAFGTPFGTPLAPIAAAGASHPGAGGYSVGKSDGGLFSPSSEGTRICVLCITDIGRTVCGGSAGASGTSMCMIRTGECSVAKHQESKAFLSITKPSESNTFVCIMQQGGKTIHTNLVFPFESIGSNRLELLLKQSRQFDQWEMLFRGVLAPGADADAVDAFTEFENSINKRDLVEEDGLSSSSPIKRPKPTEDDTDEFKLSTVDSDDTEYFTITTQNNLKSLGERMDGIEAKVNHHDLPAMDHHLSNLQRLIGQRLIDRSPIEVLTHVEMIATSVKELSNNPRNILSVAEQNQLQDVFKLYGSDLRGLWDPMSGDVKTYHAPMEAYFSKCTSVVATGQPLVMGDILVNRITSMESAVASLKSAARLSRQQAGHSSNFWAAGLSTPLRNGTGYRLGGFGQATSFGTPPGTQIQSPAELQNAITGLTTRIVELENSISEEPGPPIMLDGMQIKNRTYFKAWLNSHARVINADLVSCFPDGLGLLAMAGRSTKDDVNLLDLESESVKAGYADVNHFLISKSFMSSLPVLFGTDKEGSTADSRILPRYKTFEYFDPQLNFTGGLTDMKGKITQVATHTTTHIDNVLDGFAKLAALACVTRADAFIRELFSWTSSTFHMLSIASGNTSKAEAWNYVSHTVWLVFTHMQKSRSPGYGTRNPGPPVTEPRIPRI